MKGAKSGRIVAIAFVMALGIAGSIYTGYWSKMERYLTSIVSPSSVQAPAWAGGGQGLQAVQGNGSAAGTANAAGRAGAAGAAGAAGPAGPAGRVGAAGMTGSGNAAGAGTATGAPAAVSASGQSLHGGPQSTGFNASLLPKIAGYATVLGLFAALVRLVDLLRKRRLAAHSVEARLAAGSAAAPATGVAGAASAGGLAGAVAREAP